MVPSRCICAPPLRVRVGSPPHAQAVVLPDWTLPLKVPNTGVLKLGLHLLRPPHFSDRRNRAPAAAAAGDGDEDGDDEEQGIEGEVALAFKADVQAREPCARGKNTRRIKNKIPRRPRSPS